ncbi:Adenine deaminase [Spirosomataceae bacterium TFI 002]|nr:Adenine deaminase [Spirosomataceae bacterium TFI 002]
MNVYKGNIIDIFENQIYLGELLIRENRVFGIKNLGNEDPSYPYIGPGLVDAHVHIESSMLTPSEFSKLAVLHGSIATVSDPHEIANVLGVEGVKFMISNGNTVPFQFSFGVPSCVPATTFESAGARLELADVKSLLSLPEVTYLAEMMNFPGVIAENPTQIDIVNAALEMGKKVDGHAPGVRGEAAVKYFSKGISTDHECFTLDEAQEKLNLGVKILIREGSAAKNFEALIPLAKANAHQMMFCSDDKHPDELLEGHINKLCKRAIEVGVDFYDVLRMASLNPVLHYNIPVGLLREGESADFVIWNNKTDFIAQSVFIGGEKVMEDGKCLFETTPAAIVNNFSTQNVSVEQLQIPFVGNEKSRLQVIKINEGQLVTDLELALPQVVAEKIVSDVSRDILKIVVYNRYELAPPAVAFVKGFGLQSGAIASSVAHDSHNIIAVGVDDESIKDAINIIVREKGGISVVVDDQMGVVSLPIAGIMSDKDGAYIAKEYKDIDSLAKQKLGSTLKAPYMTLSFMALLVIPRLKLSDKGLFDGETFSFTPLLKEV